MDRKIEQKLIDNLKKTGLSQEESRIYLTLIQHGKKGTYVKDLTRHTSIERTTIYSLLKRLIEKRCVIEAEQSNAPKNAKIFIALSPINFIKKVLEEKERQLKELKELELILADKLEKIFQMSVVYPIEEVNEFLKPYLKPLIEKGWKIISQIIEKSEINFGFEAYDCILLSPDAKIIKDSGFIAFKFDYEIENDNNSIDFIINLLRRKGKEEIINKGIGVKDVKLTDSKIKIFGKIFPSFKIEFLFNQNNEYQELTKSIILPIKKKIFFIWTETHEILKEIVEVVFKVENIKI